MTTRLTNRGKWAIGIAVAGFLMGWLFGGRNLNVIVVPAVILVLATWGYVSRFEEPRVRRHAPTHGEQGETRRLDYYVESEIGYPATVVQRISEGLEGTGPHHIVTDGQWIREEIGLATRGRQTIGPTRITAADPLGLWEREFTDADTESVMVYPRIRSLSDESHLLGEFLGLTDERDRFDSVREYQSGDPLRDINWKASAKRPGDLIVTQFAGEGTVTRVTIEAEAVGQGSDRVAEATASVAMVLLEAGLAVGLVTTQGHLEPGHGDSHRRELLEMLAVLEPGRIRMELPEEPDIRVSSPRGSRHVDVRVGSDRVSYAELQSEGSEVVGA